MKKNSPMPGSLKAAGGMMVAYASLSLVVVLIIILVPLIIWAASGEDLAEQADLLQSAFYTMEGVSTYIMRGVAGLFVIAMFTNLIFSYIILIYGVGILRNRLTKKPPTWIPVLILVSVLVSFSLNPWIIKLIFGIMIMIFLSREETKRYYLWYHGKPLPDMGGPIPPPPGPPPGNTRLNVYSGPSPYAYNKHQL
jgi:hypothetical protein